MRRASEARGLPLMLCARCDPKLIINLADMGTELAARLHREIARIGQLDWQELCHARRPRRQHSTMRGEENRLLNVVGDENDRLAALLPDAQHFQIHLLAR